MLHLIYDVLGVKLTEKFVTVVKYQGEKGAVKTIFTHELKIWERVSCGHDWYIPRKVNWGPLMYWLSI